MVTGCNSNHVRQAGVTVADQYNSKEREPGAADLRHNDSDLLWIERYQTLRSARHFSFEGYLLVKSPNTGYRAKMKGVVDDDTLVMDLSGPLSYGRVRLIINQRKDLYLLLTRKGKISAPSLDELMSSAFRIAPPIDALLFWIKGIPQNNEIANIVINQAGQLTSFDEAGFKVAIEDYTLKDDAGQLDMKLPQKITLKNEQLTVKLAIASMNLH